MFACAGHVDFDNKEACVILRKNICSKAKRVHGAMYFVGSYQFCLHKRGGPFYALFEDEEQVNLATGPVSSSYRRHIDVRHHVLRELHYRERQNLSYRGTQQVADIGTK